MWILEKSDYLYLLLVLPVLVGLFLYTLYWQRKRRAEFGDAGLIKRLSPGKSGFKSTLKYILLLLAVTAIIIALINPQTGTRSETIKREGIDIVFAIDVSKSMLAEDVAPNRLDKGKQIVSQIINQLGTDRIGIVGYAGSAYPVLPITSDFGMAKMYLQGMNTNMVSSQGTAIGDAIKLSSTFFDNPKTSKVLILISDGEDHGKGTDKIAEQALEKNIKIISIGVGTEEGGPIPLKEDGITRGYKRDGEGKVVVTKLYPGQLAELAETTKGQYVYGGSTKQVASRVKKIMSGIQKAEYETRSIAGFDSQYQWFAALAFALLFIDILLLEQKTAWIRKLNIFKRKK